MYDGDEMFWYEAVVLACDSIESDEDIKAKDRFSRVNIVLCLMEEHFLSLFITKFHPLRKIFRFILNEMLN